MLSCYCPERISISDLETPRTPGTNSFLRCILLSESLILTSSSWNWLRDVQDMDGQHAKWCMDLSVAVPLRVE